MDIAAHWLRSSCGQIRGHRTALIGILEDSERLQINLFLLIFDIVSSVVVPLFQASSQTKRRCTVYNTRVTSYQEYLNPAYAA
ncbi:hypothetical protein VTL71DRAFT_7811, partial [Oculimacula yallundae]